MLFETFWAAQSSPLSVVFLSEPARVRDLRASFAELEWQNVLISLAIALVAVLAARLLAWALLRLLTRWATHTSTMLDDAVVRHLPTPIRWLLPVFALRLVVPLLGLGPAEPLVRHALLLALVALLGFAVFRGARVLEDMLTSGFDISAEDNLEARRVCTQVRGLRNIAGFVIVVATLGLALVTFEQVRELGAGILASAGIATVVIGFAAQRSIATILAGFQIAITQPIRIDDVVIVENEWGRIEEITLTYVVVRIWDMRRLVVPITYFIEKPFQNWTRTSAEILGTVMLHLDYTVPIGELRDELARILATCPKWDGKVSGIQVTDCSERTLTVRALVSARNAGDAWDLRCEVREKLIDYVLLRHPHALPRLRGTLEAERPAVLPKLAHEQRLERQG
jgi:small-conductance mechanosensitive channel